MCDTASNPENTEMASKKLKLALEETEKDIIRQVLITAAPLIFSFQDFYQLSLTDWSFSIEHRELEFSQWVYSKHPRLI